MSMYALAARLVARQGLAPVNVSSQTRLFRSFDRRNTEFRLVTTGVDRWRGRGESRMEDAAA